MPSWSLLGLKLALSGDCAEAEERLSVTFSKATQRRHDLAVRFFDRALPRRRRGEIPGVGFRVDWGERRLDFLLPRRMPLAKRRGRFVQTSAFAFSIVAGERPKRYVLAIHASAVAGRKGALVFCGYSTYGKSTISRLLSKRYPKFADDRIMLLCEASASGKRPRIRAIFFERYVEERFGERSAHKCRPWALPVAGIFWLNKGKAFSLERMGTAEALASILPPLGLIPSETAHKIFWLKKLLQQTPCLKLSFAKNRSRLVDFLDAHGFH